MGLDMYLNKVIYVGANYEHRKITGEISIKKGDSSIPINLNKVSEITEQAIYWRKANQIHKWFIDNCADGEDDCREMSVRREQLEELRNVCQTVLDSSKLVKGQIANGQKVVDGEWVNIYEDGEYIENPEAARLLLPTTSGFFFGSTEYDQYYIEDLKYTVEKLNELLAEDIPQGMDVYYEYHASW